MRVAVYCSSAPEIDSKYMDLARQVGDAIAKRGWELVWGGGTISMMGAVSRGARDAGGKTFGFIRGKVAIGEPTTKPQGILRIVFHLKNGKGGHVQKCDSAR